MSDIFIEKKKKKKKKKEKRNDLTKNIKKSQRTNSAYFSAKFPSVPSGFERLISFV